MKTENTKGKGATSETKGKGAKGATTENKPPVEQPKEQPKEELKEDAKPEVYGESNIPPVVEDNQSGQMPPIEPIATWDDVEDTVVEVLMGDLGAIAQNQRIREACYAVVAEYEKQIAPKPLSVEEMASINYNRLVSQYGKDFVTAQKGSNKQYFSRHSWVQMPKDKYGWTEITTPLPELQGK